MAEKTRRFWIFAIDIVIESAELYKLIIFFPKASNKDKKSTLHLLFFSRDEVLISLPPGSRVFVAREVVFILPRCHN
jgi:hypothetical protein